MDPNPQLSGISLNQLLNLLSQLIISTRELKKENAVTIPAASYYDDSLEIQSGPSAAVVLLRVSYSSAASSGIRVIWLYSADGEYFDTEESAVSAGNYQDIYFAAGTTQQQSLLVPYFAPFVKIRIRNNDTGNSVDVKYWIIDLK